jgi:large-conductance mechanosensitive channel
VSISFILLAFMLYMLFKPYKNGSKPKSYVKKNTKEKVTV